jgi:hypothetical protein
MAAPLLQRLLALSVVLLGLAAGACTPAIGDPCASSLECPESSTCDTSAVNGYCLSYDCEYGGCPDDSVCVRFDTFTACMASCSVDGDCRTAEGFVCRDDLDPAPFCFHPDSAP